MSGWLDYMRRIGRSFGRDRLKEQLVAHDPTAGYEPTLFYRSEVIVNELPMFNLYTARLMEKSDPIVSFALNIRNAALMVGEVEVTGKNQEVVEWVKAQWKTIWNRHGQWLLNGKRWGFAALQPRYKIVEGKISVDGFKAFAPQDVRALLTEGQVSGFRMRDAKLHHPYGLWQTFSSEFGLPYGTPLTKRQYPPWWEKWMDRGAKRLGQLRMIKDAYIGDVFEYPHQRVLQVPDGKGGLVSVPWHDIVREMAEQRLSGGALTIPMVYDKDGRNLVKYTPPQNIPGGTDIFQWEERLDEQILRGADISMEVIKAADTGSGYSGRSIPFLVLLGTTTQEFKEIVSDVDRDILRPNAWLNFGGEPEYEITATSLVDSFSKDTQGSPMGGAAMGGQASQQAQQQQQAARMGWVGQDGNVTQFDESDPHWVTIGGRKDGDEEHKGGFPVQIDRDGRIIKSGGPQGLVGRHVSEAGKHFESERRDKAREQETKDWGSRKGYGTIVARQAARWRIDPETYEQVADDVWQDRISHHGEREAAKQYARKRLNLNAGDVERLENQGLDSGSQHKKIKGLDTVGREMASLFPALGWGEGYGDEDGHDYSADLWDLVKEGKQGLPAKSSREYHEAVDEFLRSEWDRHKTRKKNSVDDEPVDSSQFGERRLWSDDDEEKHPRSDDGKWTDSKGGAKEADEPFTLQRQSKREGAADKKPNAKEKQGKLLEGMNDKEGQTTIFDGPTKRPETYIRGDRAEYTGKQIDGMHELEMMEGIHAGTHKLTARGPDGSDPYSDRNKREWKEQQADFARLHKATAKSDLSDQELVEKDYADNFANVSADPPNATSRNLHRAIGFLRGRERHYDRQLERGDITKQQHKTLVDGAITERDWYAKILKDRGDYAGGGPYSDEKPAQFDEAQSAPDEIAAIAAKSAGSRIRGAASRIRALKKNTLTPLSELSGLIELEILALHRGLSADLSASMLGGQIVAAADVWTALPASFIPPTLPGAPPEPPSEPPTLGAMFGPEEPAPEVRFPVVEDALEVLAEATAQAQPNYQATAEAVKQGAFAITGELTDKAVDDVRNILVENLAKGPDREAFIDTVIERLGEGGPLSEAHVENVFRTNVASAMSDAQDRALKNPVVAGAFPFRGYSATHDTRVRKEHRELETLGIDGTNIYWFDDPTFIRFRPPWSFQCRCVSYPVTVEQAARKGVRVAQEWLERAREMADANGGSLNQYLENAAPSAHEFVPTPPFNPPPEFHRNEQFSEQPIKGELIEAEQPTKTMTFAESLAEGLKALSQSLASIPPPVVNITLPEQQPAQITVNVPQQLPPIVNVTLPEFPAQVAPVVNVTMPEQQPPVVNVAAPSVTIEPAQVTVNVEAQEQAEYDIEPERDPATGFVTKLKRVPKQ